MLVEPRRIELHHRAVPKAPRGGIVVRVRAALTDGTDLKAYRRGHPKMPMPTPFGHEFSGDVAAIGSHVETFAPGDAVMCTHTAPCGACFWCRNGEEELCESVMPTMILGAYADHIVVPERIVGVNCFHKPDELSYRDAAFLEPLSCVVHSVAKIVPEEGSTVAVVGNGGFGILHALVLAHEGVRVVLFGRREERNALARSLGIDVVDLRSFDAKQTLLDRTEGRGADALVECTGSKEIWEQAPELVRRGGVVSFFGGLPIATRVAFLAERLHYDEVRLMSPFHFTPAAVRRARDLLVSRAIEVAPLVSDAYPLAEIATAFGRLDRGEGMKALIEP